MIKNLANGEVYRTNMEAKRKFRSFIKRKFDIDFSSFKTSKSELKQIVSHEKALLVDFIELYQVSNLNTKTFDKGSVELISALRDKLQMLYVYFSEYRNVTLYNIEKLNSYYDYFEYLNFILSLPSQETDKKEDPVQIIQTNGVNLQGKLKLFSNLVSFLNSKEKNAILIETNDVETIDELFSSLADSEDDMYTIINERRKLIRANLCADKSWYRSVQQRCG